MNAHRLDFIVLCNSVQALTSSHSPITKHPLYGRWRRFDKIRKFSTSLQIYVNIEHIIEAIETNAIIMYE